MSMGEKLSYLKKRDKLTSEDLALRAGVPLGTLNKILNGQTRNPAPHTICQLCEVFGVSLHYLLSDNIPADDWLNAQLEGGAPISLSVRELSYLRKYRQLDEREKRSLEAVLDSFCTYGAVIWSNGEKLLPCYVAIAQDQRGSFGNALVTKTLRVPLDAITRRSDFAVQLSSHSLEPIYKQGDVLVAQSGQASHNQVGFFLLNREVFIRKFSYKQGVTKLVSLHMGLKDITIQPSDALHCRGIILGMVHNYQQI